LYPLSLHREAGVARAVDLFIRGRLSR
jgi:hypothetical protein